MMASLKSIYQSFLANPDPSALSDDASLSYITTLTTINTATAIIKHHIAHRKTLTKKEEKVLSYIESSDAVCLDIETTLEFLTGGGAYLPGLDDNFLADRVVTFPMIHIVHFDSSQKIQQVRIYWDQGSLLKLVDVIGARAKNWPIRDGKDQARLIASSAASMVQSNGSARPNPANPLRQPNEAPTHRASVKPPPRGYHDLFAGNDSDASPEATARATSPQKDVGGIRAPKAQSAKPPSRDYHDLFVGNESDASPVSKGKIASQQKENVTPGPMAPKGGAHKNYQPSRLFETADPQSGTPGTPIGSPDKFYKPHPKKYNHFEFGDGDESQKPMAARPKSKHQNNWDFEDFLTPDKLPSKIRAQDIRHFGWSDDEPVMDSPLKHPAVAKARPDAKTNFEFHDEGTPAGERRPANHPRGKGNVKGAGIYENNVFDENDLPPSPEKKGHKVTNLEDMRKNFDPHFSMTDDSPSVNDNKQPIPEARAKVVQQMDAQWESSDQSPGAQSSNINENRILHVSGDKENFSNVGIKSSGDGMGGRKGAGRTWGFGDDSDEDGAGGANNGKFMASKIQQAPKTSGFWDF